MKFIWLPIKSISMLIISSIISSIVLFNNQSLAQLKLDKFDGDILSDLTSLPPGSSPILRPNQAGRKIDWRKILTSQFQEFTFKLPPPPPGKPVSGRIRGGGRRGSSYCPNTETSLTALVPAIRKTIKVGQTNYVENNDWGLTTSERTTFYFYIPFSKSTDNQTSFPTKFFLQDEKTKKIIYQSAVELPSKPGVIAVPLPKTVKPLELKKNYRWFFQIYCKPDIPEQLEGVVRRVKLSQKLIEKINAAQPREQARLYAAEGIWFDSLDMLAKLRQKEPENKQLIKDWKNLVESIGVVDVADKPLVE